MRTARTRRHTDLEAVLAGVAAACDEALGAVDGHGGCGHELHLGQHDARHHALQHLRRLGALHGDEAVVGQRLHRGVLAALDEVGQVRGEVGQVLVLMPSVDHHIEVLARIRHDAVVDHAAVLVGQQAERTHARWQVLQVGHAHLLHELDAIRATDHDAEHVGHIEDADRLPRLHVRLEDGPLLRLVVLHGHLPPTKRHHLTAERDVRVVQRRAAQRRIRRRGEVAAQRRREQPLKPKPALHEHIATRAPR
mmetsp:Transcript_26620/g.62940  ORF Transcript_26620/g.62940 Transcript_26620/m.62940 type:complete len:251 (+) Transcript_26620:746-1498(+)